MDLISCECFFNILFNSILLLCNSFIFPLGLILGVESLRGDSLLRRCSKPGDNQANRCANHHTGKQETKTRHDSSKRSWFPHYWSVHNDRRRIAKVTWKLKIIQLFQKGMWITIAIKSRELGEQDPCICDHSWAVSGCVTHALSCWQVAVLLMLPPFTQRQETGSFQKYT